jgi:hypothetical protein
MAGIGAPAATEETQAFIRQSRQSSTRRRDVLTGGLAVEPSIPGGPGTLD